MSKGTVTIPIEEFDRLREVEKQNRILNREDELIALEKKVISMTITESYKIRSLEYTISENNKEIINLKAMLKDVHSQIELKEAKFQRLKDSRIKFPWYTTIVVICIVIYHITEYFF